ncbi:MAG: glutathione synthase, partial [Gammaproteobacteria bacterium]|nr:glutathione synthase [Gammaproteobacteria bacterium]
MADVLRLAFLMDPIESITPYKDSTLAMMLAAQRKDWGKPVELYVLQQADLQVRNGKVAMRVRRVEVADDNEQWFQWLEESHVEPAEFVDVVLMRKDPPFDIEYVTSTWLLELAEQQGVLVVNKPQALRDCNEKAFIAQFPHCCTDTLISRSADDLRAFVAELGDVILKPLDGMGGAGIFRVTANDPNLSVVLETLLHGGATVMAQRYLPAIKDGDKRILMVDGEAVPYALARIPADGETRGNIAAGGRGVAQPLSDKDRWLAEQIGPELKA